MGPRGFLLFIVLRRKQGDTGATGKMIEHRKVAPWACMPPSVSGGTRVSYLQLEGGRIWGG